MEKVISTIIMHQDSEHADSGHRYWDQTTWYDPDRSCGTAMCFAGWTVHLSDRWSFVHDGVDVWAEDSDGYSYTVAGAARRELGLTGAQASILFDGNNTLDDLIRLVGKFSEA